MLLKIKEGYLSKLPENNKQLLVQMNKGHSAKLYQLCRQIEKLMQDKYNFDSIQLDLDILPVTTCPCCFSAHSPFIWDTC